MSRDLGRDVLDLEKLYARKLWADFSYPKFWPQQDRTIYHHRGTQSLADPARAMVDMLFLCFPGLGYLQ